MIAIIDYGSGNINAIATIYKRLNIDYVITKDPDVLKKADKLILPGVGDFDETMGLLEEGGLKNILNDLVLKKKVPVLGVCVGMHVMAKSSEEGIKPGLGWVDAKVKMLDKYKLTEKPLLPHMGWNSIKVVKPNNIFNNIVTEKGFYFLHSYFFDCEDKNIIICTSDYGLNFPSGINSNNVYGFQFHPEKSHSNGVSIFKNFAELN